MSTENFKKLSEKTFDSVNRLQELVNQLRDLALNYSVKVKKLAEKMDLISPTGEVFGYGMFTMLKAYQSLSEFYGCKGPTELKKYIEELKQKGGTE